MRADNTSVVTLMLDPPGPPRATVLRSRTTQKPQSTVPPAIPTPATTKVEEKTETPAEPDNRQVPQNGLTIMTRYSDVDKPTPSTETPERTPLPPCATLDGRFSVGPQDETPKTIVTSETNDDDAITNYGNPAESYFMARLLNRSRVVNTLSEVFEEIVNGRASKAGSEARDAPAPETIVPAGDSERTSPEKETVADEPEDVATDADGTDKDDVGIQINEVSSSSPVEGPPRPRGRRPKSEAKRDAPAAPNDRVLRSHHDNETPHRPHTRQTRGKVAPAAPPAPPADRVVILSRRAPVVAAPSYVRVERGPARRPTADGAPLAEPARATRSQAGAGTGTPLAQKITRSIGNVARELGARAGNSPRAPGPAPARRAPAARRDPSLGSKENLPAAARRRPRAAPAAAPPCPPAPAPPRAASEPEVHSTTTEPAAPAPCRALRSRNDAEPAAKRSRCEEGAGAGALVKAERCARALGKRASGPWAPALALRNRLRKRLAK